MKTSFVVVTVSLLLHACSERAGIESASDDISGGGEQMVPAYSGAKPSKEFEPLPAFDEQVPAELRRLRELARSDRVEDRETAIGQLLPRIAKAQSRELVENWLGEGSREADGEVVGYPQNTTIVTYYARMPGLDGTQLMTVVYSKETGVQRVVSVDGPHYPD